MRKSIKHTKKTDKSYFLTLTVVNWVDVFSRKNHRDAFIDSLRHCQEHKALAIFWDYKAEPGIHLFHVKHQALQVLSLGMVNADRVVGWLRQLVDDTHVPS